MLKDHTIHRSLMRIIDPLLTPEFVSRFMIRKLRQRHRLRDVLNPVLRRLGQHRGIIGFKITCSGRFHRGERATYLWQKQGKLPLNTFRELIDYDFYFTTLRFGVASIKVWISYDIEYFKSLKKMIPFLYRIY